MPQFVCSEVSKCYAWIKSRHAVQRRCHENLMCPVRSCARVRITVATVAEAANVRLRELSFRKPIVSFLCGCRCSRGFVHGSGRHRTRAGRMRPTRVPPFFSRSISWPAMPPATAFLLSSRRAGPIRESGSPQHPKQFASPLVTEWSLLNSAIHDLGFDLFGFPGLARQCSEGTCAAHQIL